MVLFQPIFEPLEKGLQLYGLECLVRGPKGTHVEAADILFDYVRRKGEETRIDRACVEAILRAVQDIPGNHRIGINVHASTLGRDVEFPVFLRHTADSFAVNLSRVTVEIVEHTPSWDTPNFLRALDEIRQMGILVALDDVGLGQSNYRMILDSRPDVFKVDTYLVQDCCRDPYRRAVLESIIHLAHSFGARVIAEGIEEPEDFQTVAALGVDLVQGFLLARPMSADRLVASGLLEYSKVPLAAPVWACGQAAACQTLEKK